MNLSSAFTQTIQGVFGDKGLQWLQSLPTLIDTAKKRWGLEEVQTAPNLSYNYVAFARQDASDVVLKIGVPHETLTNEIAALRLFNGEGAVKLLEADEHEGLFLLERIQPGCMLSALQDDDKATHIAIDVMLKLWRSPPSDHTFPNVADWFTIFENKKDPLIERTKQTLKEFFAEKGTSMLLHGDLHHFNILSSDKSWLAIDPKGVIGPIAYEVGPFLLNPWREPHSHEEIVKCTERRIAILSERLGFEKERILKWAIAHALLSVCWSLEDNTDWRYAMACANIFSRMKV
jgi:streptomycin 6-kinase